MYKLFATVLLLVSAMLSTQEVEESDSPLDPPWILAEHELSVKESLEEIGTIITRGYQVVGMDTSNNYKTLSILYVKTSEPHQIWSLYEFERLDSFEAEFSAFLQKQWVPVDIAKTEGGLYVFFIKDTTVTPASWRINVARSAEQIESIREALTDIDFHVTGITQSDVKEYWLLSLRTADLPTEAVLSGYKQDELTGNIESVLADNYTIDGIINIEDLTFIQFIKQ